jgi:hypothetical protein
MLGMRPDIAASLRELRLAAMQNQLLCRLVAIAVSLGGCGVQVPAIEPLARSQDEVAFAINNIANHIKCQVRDAVNGTLATWANVEDDRIRWLEDWSAKVTLTITIREVTNFNPGISFNTIFPSSVINFGNSATVTTPQMFSFGIGGQFSTDATRIEQIDFFFVFKELIRSVGPCPRGAGPQIEGDLKFGEWLNAAALLSMTRGTISYNAGAAPFDVLSHQVNFIIIAGGNVTPTWKLVAVTANANAPLLGATRTRTDNVLMTLGPVEKQGPPTAPGPPAPAQPTQAVVNSHLASQIGLAVANSVRALQP